MLRRERQRIYVCVPGGASHAPTLGGGLYELDKEFDIIGGSGASAGALNIIALAFGVDAKELLKLYQELLQHDRILDKSVRAAPRYGRCLWQVIGEAVSKLLGKDARMGDALIPIAICVTNARKSRPLYVTSWTHPHAKVSEVATATSALIPLARMVYIPSLDLGLTLFYDGGFTDNNPDHLFDDKPEPTWSMHLVDTDRDADGEEDEIALHEWDFDAAALSVARSITYAASARKSERKDRVCIPIQALGSGLNFNLTPAQTEARFRAGAAGVRTFLEKR